nr:ATP-binding protein [Anaerobacillus isosaccharinicus]
MMNEQTLTKLHELKLSGMAEAYKEQSTNKEFQKLSFEERFSLLVDLEHSVVRVIQLQRLINTATFLNSKCLYRRYGISRRPKIR